MAELTPLNAHAREAAMKKAAHSRQVRAKLKQEIKAGATSISQALEQAHRDDAVGRLKVCDLLQALPGVGAVRCAKIMEAVGIASSRRCRGLGKHQRSALIQYLATAELAK